MTAMLTDMVTRVRVGSKVIVVHRDGKPEVARVEKVTPKYSIRVVGFKDLFKPQDCYREQTYWEVPDSNWRHSPLRVYEWNEANLAQLEYDYSQVLEGRAAAKVVQDARQAEREAEDARKMAETKAACGGSLICRQRMVERLPDGARLYALSLPVKADHERKKGYSIVMVKVWDYDPAFSWPGKIIEEKVEAAFTYADGSTRSFASCSTYKAKDDEDALWQAADYCYHSW